MAQGGQVTGGRHKEILECFNSNITECFNDMVKEGPDFKAVNIAKSLLKGDEKKVEDLLSEVILIMYQQETLPQNQIQRTSIRAFYQEYS